MVRVRPYRDGRHRHETGQVGSRIGLACAEESVFNVFGILVDKELCDRLYPRIKRQSEQWLELEEGEGWVRAVRVEPRTGAFRCVSGVIEVSEKLSNYELKY